MRRSRAGRVVGIVVGVLVALVVGLFALVIAFGAPVVDGDDVEQQIASEFGVAPSQVECPGSLDGEVGARMTCTAVEGGVTTPIFVQVTGVEGDMVNFTMTPQ